MYRHGLVMVEKLKRQTMIAPPPGVGGPRRHRGAQGGRAPGHRTCGMVRFRAETARHPGRCRLRSDRGQPGADRSDRFTPSWRRQQRAPNPASLAGGRAGCAAAPTCQPWRRRVEGLREILLFQGGEAVKAAPTIKPARKAGGRLRQDRQSVRWSRDDPPTGS